MLSFFLNVTIYTRNFNKIGYRVKIYMCNFWHFYIMRNLNGWLNQTRVNVCKVLFYGIQSVYVL